MQSTPSDQHVSDRADRRVPGRDAHTATLPDRDEADSSAGPSDASATGEHPAVPPPSSSAAPPKVPRPTRRTVIAMAGVALAGILLVLRAWHLWPFTSPIVTTDDSYVRGQITVLAPQVNGYVAEVLAPDFARVEAGQPLVRIDDRIYRQQVDLAEGQLAAAQAELANSAQSLAQGAAELGSRRASLVQAEAERERARADFARVTELAERGSVSLRERDQIRAALLAAEAGVQRARAAIEIGQEAVEATRVSRGALEARVKTAQAQLDLARINLANTLIRAPRAGQVSEASVRPGQYVAAGSQLLFLVPDTLWVIANYKEAQTERMAPGQWVTFAVDALGGAELTGRVERIAPAAGSEFSVLRPDNASGNFTKVAQRIPVRIAIDPGQPLARRLRPGMSVVAHVNTASRAGAGAPRAARAVAGDR